jgi:GNAT superfamily N-acetyltransferase
MLKTTEITNFNDIIIEKWNQEFEKSFPITDQIFKQKITDNDFLLEKESICLFDDDEYLGCIIFKKFNDSLYISLFHIVKKHRFKGRGKFLFIHAYTVALKHNLKKMIIGSDPDCLFSGLFVSDNTYVHKYLINKGYEKSYNNFNLLCDKPPEDIDDLKGYVVEFAKSEAEKDEALNLIKHNFSDRWFNEVSKNKKENISLLKNNQDIIGFINTSDGKNEILPNSLNLYPLFDNLAGIGPLGIIEEYQSQGLGKFFVKKTLKMLFEKSASEVMVDWTGLIEFYQKCGFKKIYSEYIIYCYNMEI